MPHWTHPGLRPRHLYTLGVGGLILLLVLVACSQPAPTPTPVPPAAVPATQPAPAAAPTTAVPATQPAGPAALTAVLRAPLGQAIYKSSCGACHDGPPGGNLENSFNRFSNAGQMFDYARTKMPQNNPGSLPQADYLNVIVWVLLGSNKVTPDAVLDAGNLASVSLP